MSCDPAASGIAIADSYLLDEAGNELSMFDQGTWQLTNVFGNGELLATYDAKGLHFHLKDALGTRRVQTDDTGAPEEDCTSLPFGDQASCTLVSNPPATADDATPLHFTGKERDTESGNDYFGARYYGSSMGRFSSPDPSGVAYADPSNPQSFNLYAYVMNNPLINIDPAGTECVWDDGSYDSVEDFQTGTASVDASGNYTGCTDQGGTWVDHSVFTSNNMADWSSQANSTLADFVFPAARVTGSNLDVPMSGNVFSFSGMTQNQAINMFQQAGFIYSPVDTLLSEITRSHPGVNMRGKNPNCSIHLNIDPGSGQNGNPVTGSFHYDLFSPLEPGTDVLSPERTAAHAAADVAPDLLIQYAGTPKTWTGNSLCE